MPKKEQPISQEEIEGMVQEMDNICVEHNSTFDPLVTRWTHESHKSDLVEKFALRLTPETTHWGLMDDNHLMNVHIKNIFDLAEKLADEAARRRNPDSS